MLRVMRRWWDRRRWVFQPDTPDLSWEARYADLLDRATNVWLRDREWDLKDTPSDARHTIAVSRLYEHVLTAPIRRGER